MNKNEKLAELKEKYPLGSEIEHHGKKLIVEEYTRTDLEWCDVGIHFSYLTDQGEIMTYLISYESLTQRKIPRITIDRSEIEVNLRSNEPEYWEVIKNKDKIERNHLKQITEQDYANLLTAEEIGELNFHLKIFYLYFNDRINVILIKLNYDLTKSNYLVDNLSSCMRYKNLIINRKDEEQEIKLLNLEERLITLHRQQEMKKAIIGER